MCKEKVIKLVVKRILDAQKELASNNVVLNMLTNEKKKAENALNNLVKALERGSYGIRTSTTKGRISSLTGDATSSSMLLLPNISSSNSSIEYFCIIT